MVLPTNQISFSDLRRVIGPNNTAAISLGQCRPSFQPAYGNGLTGVTDTNIAMSQFRGKSKIFKSGLSFRAFKDSAYTFTLGTGGAGGTASPYSSPYSFPLYGHGGGGGGAGILVNGGGAAGGGGRRANLNGGAGGTGYGAGGGTSAHTNSPDSSTYYMTDIWEGLSGGGSGGFAYLALNNSEFFTDTSTTYTCRNSGTLQFIIVGAGANGTPYLNVPPYYNNPSNISRNGGNSGSLNYGSIAVTSGTSITITVGLSNGASTSIVVNGTTYTAAGGNGGIAFGGESGALAINGSSGTAGGNAGTGIQPLSYLNTALTSISIVGAYFADNISLFRTYKAFATGITTNMTNLTSATNGTYTINGSATNFSVEWVGQFYPPTTGSYTFYLNSDDASYLWIGSNASSGYTTANANINNGGLHGMVNVSYTVTLTGGTLYPIRIQYGQKEGGYDLQFSFTGPSISLTYNMDGYVYN